MIYFNGRKGGHRDDYYSYFENRLQCGPVEDNTEMIWSKKLLIFTMAEDNLLKAIVISIARIICRKKTVLLLFKPFYDTAISKSYAKLIFLKVFDILNLCEVIPIIPNHCYNRKGFKFKRHCLDPQFYDLDDKLPSFDCVVSLEKYDALKNLDFDRADPKIPKAVILVVGLSKRKGADALLDYLKRFGGGVKLYLIGHLDEEYKSRIVSMCDCEIVGWVNNEKLFEYYKAVNLIWCCYEESYDQSSGILGRAFQFEKCPIVREGSVVEKLARLLFSEYIIISSNGDRYIKNEEYSCGSVREILEQYKIESVLKKIA